MLLRLRMYLAPFGILCSIGVAAAVGIATLVEQSHASAIDTLWALSYLALFLAIGVLCWLQQGRPLITGVLSASALVVLVGMLRSGAGAAFLVLAWLLVISTAIGRASLELLAPSLVASTSERLVISTSIGFGGLALLTLALSLLKLLYPTVIYGILVALTALLAPMIFSCSGRLAAAWPLRSGNAWEASDLRVHGVVLACIAASLFGAFVWALAPSIQADALIYHLGVPIMYVRQHGMFEIIEEVGSYWAHNAEMLYTLALALTGQPLPAFLHLTHAMLTIGLTYLLGRRIGSGRVGLFSALMLCSLPLFTWEAGTAYVDLIETLQCLVAALALLAWWQERHDAWLLVGGVASGLALGTKLNAVLVLVPLALCLGCGLLARYGWSRRSLLGALRFAVPGLLLAAPWLIRDWVWTGNPVFPWLNSVFRSPKWPAENPQFDFAAFGEGTQALYYLRLPWDLVVSAGAFGHVGKFAGACGAVPLLSLPWLYGGSSWKERQPLPLVLFTVVVIGLAIWFRVGQFLRYLLPVFPFMALLAALNIDALWRRLAGHAERRWVAALGFAIVLVYVASTRLADISVSGSQIPERYPYRFALGMESSQAFLSRTVPAYDALQFLDDQGGGPHKVLALGTRHRLYTSARLVGVVNSWSAMGLVPSLPPGESLARALGQLGYDYVLVVGANTVVKPTDYPGASAQDDLFLRKYAKLEFAHHDVFLYRLLGVGTPTRSN